jgi:hypothetical protein
LCIVQTGMWFSFSMIPSLSTVRELYFFFKVKMSFFLLLISQIKTTLVESSLRPGFLDHPKQSFTV